MYIENIVIYCKYRDYPIFVLVKKSSVILTLCRENKKKTFDYENFWRFVIQFRKKYTDFSLTQR